MYSIGKLLSSYKRSAAVAQAIEKYEVSECWACSALSINHSSIRYETEILPDEKEVRCRITQLACEYGRVGYLKVTGMLRNEGILLNHRAACQGRYKRVEGIW